MSGELVHRTGFIMCAESVDDGLARRVQADELDRSAFPAEFYHHFVEGVDSGEIPEMGERDIDANLLNHFAEIKRVGEGIGRHKEQLAADAISSGSPIDREIGGDFEELGDFPREEQRAQQDAHADAEGEIMRTDHDRDGRHHHDAR